VAGRSRRWTILVSVAIDTLLLGGSLFFATGHSGVAAGNERLDRTVLSEPANSTGVDLTVNPPTFWMRVGSTVAIEAVWSGGPPFCEVSPLWYLWSVDGGNATGLLNETVGPFTSFTAESFTSGTAVVSVRSEATVLCGSSVTTVELTNETSVSIVAPLFLSGLRVGPNPILPGQNASLEGALTGGQSPYSLRIAWGDGTTSSTEVPQSGSFSFNHSFSAGDFVPTVTVADADGDTADGSVNEALSVGTGLEAAILPEEGVAEVGVPVQLIGVVASAPNGTITFFDCTNATVVTEGSPGPNESALTCTFTTSGTAEVLFTAFSSRPGGASVTAILYERVVLAPSITAFVTRGEGEVGGTSLVRAVVFGGIPPLMLSWNLSGTRSILSDELLLGDGEGFVTVGLEQAGDYSVQLRVEDSAGVNATNISGTLTVEPALAIGASAGVELFPLDEVVQVRGSALDGCAPLDWWTVPDYVAFNETPAAGILSNLGSFSWNASYELEGNLSVTIEIVDNCEGSSLVTLDVPLVGPVRVSAAGDPHPSAPNETMTLNLSISGGMPPFQVTVNATDNQSWNRSFDRDGTFEWQLVPDQNGTVELSVRVCDSWGASAETYLSVILIPPSGPPTPPPGPTPPSSGLPSPGTSNVAESGWGHSVALATVLGVATAFGLVLFARRRQQRRKSTGAPPPDPVATLRRIIEPADGAERFTVELLAEEAGIPLALVRSTIDRLVVEGTVQSESGADGEEVLSWSSEGGH